MRRRDRGISKHRRELKMTGRLSGDEKIFQVAFQRDGCDFETLYWAGTSEETQDLARKIVLSLGADAFRIFDITGGGPDSCSDERPLKLRP